MRGVLLRRSVWSNIHGIHWFQFVASAGPRPLSANLGILALEGQGVLHCCMCSSFSPVEFPSLVVKEAFLRKYQGPQ